MPKHPRLWSRASASRSARWSRRSSPTHGRRPGHRRSTPTRRRTRPRGPAASSPCTRRTARPACSAPASAPTGASTSRPTSTWPRPAARAASPAQKNALDRFDIDFSLCMYCGICVEVCPFEALFWSPEYEYSEPRIADLLHDKDRLGRVDGDRARLRGLRGRLGAEGQEGADGLTRCLPPICSSPRTSRSTCIAAVMVFGAVRVVTEQEHRARRPLPGLVLAGVAGPVHPAGRRVRRHHPGARLHRRHRRAVPVRHHAHPGADRAARRARQRPQAQIVGGRDRRRCSPACMGYALWDGFRRHRVRRRSRCSAPPRSATRSSRTYLVPFEVVSVLLLAALIGAIVLARRD